MEESEQTQEAPNEYLEQLQRLQAEFINYRTRVEKEKQLMGEYSKDIILRKFLEIRDNFERAPKLDQGMEIIYKQFLDIFQKEGVEEIETKNFDPELHEAIATREDIAKDVIAEVARKGYKRGDRILRTAHVVVGNNDGEQTK